MAEMINIILETNKDYRKYIDLVFKYGQTIEYVSLYCQESPDLIGKYFDDREIRPTNVNKWQGTKTGSKSNLLYRFDADSSFKKILLKFDNFFLIEKRQIEPMTYACNIEDTDWGQADIAFFDKNGECISYVTAHEGDILVNNRYKDDFISFIPDSRTSFIFGLG